MPTKPYYTPSDRDYIIRTVMGEAAGEPDDGQAAVAHVILNRVMRGYGRSPTEVVFAKNQFEPWSTRRGELLGYAADAPEYKRTAAIVDGVISGKIKDPTSGATHFLQEDIVNKRSGRLPDWASGKGMKIGAHTFHYPDEPDRPESQPRYASVLDKYTKGGAPRVPAASDASPPLSEGLSIIDKYTKRSQSEVDPLVAMAPKPPESGRIEAPPFEPTRGVIPDMMARSYGRAANDLPVVGNALWNTPGEFVKSGIANAVGGYDLSRQGVKEMLQGNILPSGPVTQPSEWRAGGAAKTAAGVLQAVGGATGVIPATELLEHAVSNVTGSEAAGKTAGLIGNVAGSAALTNKLNAVRPTVRARTMAGDMSPEEIARLQSNPRLTPMDVNPSMQGKGMGLATGEGGDAAKNLLYSRARDRVESAPQAVAQVYETQFGTPPVVTEQLRQYKQTARDNARQGFGDAFKGVQFVNPAPVISSIDKVLKPGVNPIMSPGTTIAYGPLEQRLVQLRRELTDGQSVVTDPMRLHEIQYQLGAEIRNLKKSATGSDRNLGNQLGKVHDQLVKSIDDATGGKYQPARKKFKEDMEVQEAFEKGFSLFDTGKGLGGHLDDSPAAWREWWTGKDSKGKRVGEAASAEEQNAVRLAGLAEIERRIQGYRHTARSPGMTIDMTPWNREKMELVYGKPEAERLHRLLRDERDMATTDNRLLHNSKTAEAQANAKSIRPREPGTTLNDLAMPAVAEGVAWLAGGGTPGVTFGVTMAARRIANAMGRSSDEARNRILADMISLNPTTNPGNKLMPGPQSPLRVVIDKAARMTPITYVPENVRAKPVPLTKD